jgi:hypothetical protein
MSLSIPVSGTPQPGGYVPDTQVDYQKTIKNFANFVISYIQGTGTQGAGGTGDPGAPELEIPIVEIDPALLSEIVLKLQSESSDAQLATAVETLKANKANMAKKHEEALGKLLESIEKMEEAKKTSLASKIFGWLGAVASVIAGIAMIATGAGAVAGGLMIAAGAIMITQQVLAETDALSGLDSKAAMGINIALSVIAIGLSIGGGVVAAYNSANTVIEAVTIAEKIGQALKIVGAGTSIISAVGGGASGVAGAVITKDATYADADYKNLVAFITRLQAALEEDTDRIQELMDQMQSAVGIIMSMLGSHEDTQIKIAQSMAV